MQSVVQPLVQMHLLEGFLDPVEDKWPKTTEEEHLLKIEKMVLSKHNTVCLAHEPKNGPMRILTAAVWLKLRRKYFNQGTAKKACQLFNIQAKQLLGVLTGRKYLGSGDKKGTGPKTRGKKQKSVTSSSEMKKVKTKEDGNDDEDDDDNTAHQKVKDRPHWVALIWEHLHICQLDNLNATCPMDNLNGHSSHQQQQCASISSSAQKSSWGMASSLILHITTSHHPIPVTGST